VMEAISSLFTGKVLMPGNITGLAQRSDGSTVGVLWGRTSATPTPTPQPTPTPSPFPAPNLAPQIQLRSRLRRRVARRCNHRATRTVAFRLLRRECAPGLRERYRIVRACTVARSRPVRYRYVVPLRTLAIARVAASIWQREHERRRTRMGGLQCAG
jgi:hypothetical protein